jgi:hypothetical protein
MIFKISHKKFDINHLPFINELFYFYKIININIMKKISIAIIIIASTLVSCKSKKTTTTDKDSGMEVINIPCDEYRTSTDKIFRATQSQKSSDLSLSREKGLVVAKQRLAGLIETKIKSVTDRYVDEYQTNAGLEMKGKFNNLTREIINQQLNDVKVLCEKTVRERK